MDEPKSGKLVRDRIPEIIRSAGGNPRTRVLDDREYELALHAKLQEETAELLAAPADERREELADVREVLLALAEYYGIDWDTVESAGVRKRHERGGFEGRILLER